MSPLKIIREKRNLTQKELAEQSGISIRTIQRIEAGAPLKGHTLKVLATTLLVEESALLDIPSPPPVNHTYVKLINLSSLPTTVFPPVNIILPLVLILITKQRNTLAKHILSVQIIWTVLTIVLLILGAMIRNWFFLDDKIPIGILIPMMLINIFIILRNAAEIDKKGKLYFTLNFSLI